ncbi:MAG: FAD-dependent oxidoreductase, partial [Planctomycetota bacterium]|nr:FAD-dependent oxidoreductase [Planctomycetota bacterium]
MGDAGRTYQCGILGLGAMGSAAAYHLTRRGWDVIGFEQFEFGHSYGSSHGQSR